MQIKKEFGQNRNRLNADLKKFCSEDSTEAQFNQSVINEK